MKWRHFAIKSLDGKFSVKQTSKTLQYCSLNRSKLSNIGTNGISEYLSTEISFFLYQMAPSIPSLQRRKKSKLYDIALPQHISFSISKDDKANEFISQSF